MGLGFHRQVHDKNTLSAPAVGNNDYAGRVKYTKGSPTVVYIYLTHR